MASTTSRKKLSNITWATQQSVRFNDGLGWTDVIELARELAATSPFLTEEQARTLISLTSSGTPVLLTWKTRFNRRQIEKKTAVAVVNYIWSPISGSEQSTGHINLSYIGFTTTILLSQVVAIEAPETQVSYETDDLDA